MTDERRKKRFLVLVDEDRAPYVRQVFEGYQWARVIDLTEEEMPTPVGKRLVNEVAWEVLRQGSRIPITSIRESLDALGTRWLSDDQRLNSEKWCLAELHRRKSEEVDYDE